MGSTKCFIEGLKNRKINYKFYSLECNKEKSNFAQKIYKDYENVYILNEVLLNKMPENTYDIFPELLNNSEYSFWNAIDLKNMENKNLFFERKDIPEFFDVILLDSGEFTTWNEYNIIKNKCKILMLDDTNVSKCKKIVEDIKQSSNWKIIFESNERNGFLICEKI